MYPPFTQIKKDIRDNKFMTLQNLADQYGYHGIETITMSKNQSLTDKYILCMNYDRSFFNHLLEFMKEPGVFCNVDLSLCAKLDNADYNHLIYEFYPIVLSLT